MKTKAPKSANARPGAFAQLAQLPKDCRWARMRLRGWNDYAKGRGFRDTYDTWHRKSQYAYERGRMQAALTVANMRVYLPLAEYAPRLAETPTGLTEWKRNELIQGPLSRTGLNQFVINQILEETRVARKVLRDKKSKVKGK